LIRRITDDQKMNNKIANLFHQTGARFYIVPQGTRRDVIIYAIIRRVCACMTLTRADFAWRTDRIVLSHTAIMICARLCTTLRKYRHWRIRILIQTRHPTGPIYSTRSGTWWTRIQNGKTRIMCWATIRQSHARDHRVSAGRDTLVRSITIVRTRDAVHANTNIGKDR